MPEPFDIHDDVVPPTGCDVGQDVPADLDKSANTVPDAVSRAELDKVIDQRQQAKDRARRAEEQLASLREQLDDLSASKQGPQDTQAAASDDSDGEGADGEQLTQRLRMRELQLAGLLRDQQLRAAAAGAGAVNPDQVVALLRTRVVMTAEPGGEFAARGLDDAGQPLIDETGQPVDVDALVGQFLSRAENANLVRAASAPGSGARQAGGSPDVEAIPRTLAGFNALSIGQRRQAAMGMSKGQRESLLGIEQAGRAGYL